MKKNSGVLGGEMVRPSIPQSLSPALDHYLSTLIFLSKLDDNTKSILTPSIDSLQSP